MDVGVIVPQGWTGEYAGWSTEDAWQRSLAVARAAERMGFESLWVYDHFHTTPEPTNELTFESFMTLAAVACVTDRIRLGHVVSCAGFRNPALVAKMISQLDVISGGRAIMGIGAGWKREEWEAYGYPFPDTGQRLERLEDALEILVRMLHGAGPATYTGRHSSVEGAINLPRPIQQDLPLMVGGNGRRRTWALAARFADELNLDALPPAAIPEAMAVIRDHCAAVGRDPASLRVSVHLWLRDRDWLRPTGEDELSLAELLARYRAAGISRVMALVPGSVDGDEALEGYARAADEAGVPVGQAG
jgi:F420-dependent oxidoreductase-like protein